MATEKPKFRCQRIGCDAFFTEDDNPEDSCRYHNGVPKQRTKPFPGKLAPGDAA